MRYHCATSAHTEAVQKNSSRGERHHTNLSPGVLARGSTGAGPAGLGMWQDMSCRAIGAAVARFLHTEEVTGSIPVSPTRSATIGASCQFGSELGSPSI